MKKRILSLVITLALITSMLTVFCMPTYAAYDYLFPVNGGNIAYYYGYTESYGDWHDGIDIHSNGDDYIYAAYSGTVGVATDPCWHVSCGYACEHYNTFGNYIRIDQDDGYSAYYGHLLQGGLLVSAGTYVTKGQPIAIMGSSGYSTGKHLHFEIRSGSTKINVNPTSAGGSINYSYSGYNGSPSINYSSVTPGDYCIFNVGTQSYLTVDDGVDANTQNVSVHSFWNSTAYKMSITNISDAYKIRPLCCSSRLVNPYADTVVSGKNVNIYDDVNESSQWWRFEAYGNAYIIRSAQNPNCVLTVSGENVIVENFTGSANQQWTLHPTVETVYYNANGGTGAPASQTKQHAVDLVLSSQIPTRTGYTFLGWSMDKNATTAQYQPGGIFSHWSGTTLYAVWGKCNHTYTNSCDTTCNKCGATRTITHTFGDYVSDGNATTEADGTKTRTCSVCGHKETVIDEGSMLIKPVTNTKTGQTYDSIVDAIDNAAPGDTIKLMSDTTAKSIMLYPDITLDLGGFKLTANYFVSLNGSSIIDSSSVVDRVVNSTYNVNGATKTGGIYVPKASAVLASNTTRDEVNKKNTAYMPIYDSASGCYRFVQAEMRDSLMKVNGSRFEFAPIIGASAEERNGIQKDLLATDNIIESGLKMGVKVIWETDGYYASQEFIMKDSMTKSYINGFGYVNGNKFVNNYKTKNGAVFTGAALKQADKVYICAIFKSDTGFELESKVIEVDTSTLS